jgi:hypothetical protein
VICVACKVSMLLSWLCLGCVLCTDVVLML